jgi:hypothetical protein
MRRLVLLAALSAAALVAAAAPAGAAAASWCGTGETAADRPDVVTGPQVRLVYAYPSDGPDGFAALAGGMVADAETSDAWWRGQDPTRTPRFDLAAFPGCTTLDLGVLRLPLTAAQLLPGDNRYTALFRALPSRESWKKTVIYYDGPIDDTTLCGTGGGSATTALDSLAVVYLRSTCMTSESLRAAVLTHELTHELGAPDGFQPHACPGDKGHVCDSGDDLMYPYLDVDSIDQLVLDVGHDDYYRQNNGGFDLSTSVWLRHLETPQQPLTVSVAAGSGTVRSDLPGPVCAGTCTSSWDAGSRVALTAEPAPGLRFVGWKGACTGLDCRLVVTAPVAVQALFGPARVRLRAHVTGRGRVLGRGLACPSACSAAVEAGQALTVYVKAAKGWRFAGWTGACRGTKANCVVVPQAAVAVGARFVRRTGR